MTPSRITENRQQWTFLTNHAHVLLCVVRSPTILIRDLATQIGITERGVQRIIADLQGSGYLTTERKGRRNRYSVRTDLALRHPLERRKSVAALIELLLESSPGSGLRATASAPRRLPPKSSRPVSSGSDGGERRESPSDQFTRSNFE